jgi:flagellar hook-basal body complex protein FliE
MDKLFDNKLQSPNNSDIQTGRTSFSQIISQKLEEVNTLQKEADQLTENFMQGGPVDVHQMLIAMEKAELALRQTLEVRNKLLEGIKEIERMQI